MRAGAKIPPRATRYAARLVGMTTLLGVIERGEAWFPQHRFASLAAAGFFPHATLWVRMTWPCG